MQDPIQVQLPIAYILVDFKLLELTIKLTLVVIALLVSILQLMLSFILLIVLNFIKQQVNSLILEQELKYLAKRAIQLSFLQGVQIELLGQFHQPRGVHYHIHMFYWMLQVIILAIIRLLAQI